MAHIAKLGGLTDELVMLITSTSAESNPGSFNVYRETALRTIRHNIHRRTNQFDVESHLNGLEEKFRVLNEDPLADALRERLDIVARKRIKWSPEILHLLLELSSKPISDSKLRDLDFLKEPDPDTGPILTWKDLMADDPSLRDRSLWRNVDFGAEGSDEEDRFEDSRSELSQLTDTTLSSIDDEFSAKPDAFVVAMNVKENLEKLIKAQFWQKIPSIDGIKLESVRKPITELQAVREVLLMLSGLPTSLFEIKVGSGIILASRGYSLKHMSAESYDKLMGTFADEASLVMFLRLWQKRPQIIPLLQILQDSILKRIANFDMHLSKMEQRFVTISEDVTISLIAIQAEVQDHMRPLIRLSDLMKRLDTERYSYAFRYLELLYDETCTSQMAGEDDIYPFMGNLFFDCLQVYLRSIRTWMEEGDLNGGDNVFFISEVESNVDPSSIWQHRFKVRKTQSGVLHAPKFLRTAAHKIFTTGKSVVVLKQLKQFRSLKTVEPKLDFDTVCNTSEAFLAPFPELFYVAFNDWVQSKHHHASSTLRRFLFDSCGLHTSLDALSHIYFMVDGTTAAIFTNSIFDKLDTLNTSWNDRFTLTELAQSSFGSLPQIAPDHLRTTTHPLSRKLLDIARCRRSVKILSIIELKYHLSWPIQIILDSNAIPSYQRVFTFLFQIRRSSHILSRQRLLVNNLNQNSSSDERSSYYCLRARLLWFTQTLYYYLTSLVLSSSTLQMQADLKLAEDVDGMMSVHTTYLKAIIDKSLLGSKLEVIHKTILQILDLGIKLEDAQAANAASNKEALEEQQKIMDLSMASLGLHTPKRGISMKSKNLVGVSNGKWKDEDSDEEELDVDLSILSATYEREEEETYVEKLRKMKGDFDRKVRFVAGGLRGVARAGKGEEGRSWDVLGEMLESGLGGFGPGIALEDVLKTRHFELFTASLISICYDYRQGVKHASREAIQITDELNSLRDILDALLKLVEKSELDDSQKLSVFELLIKPDGPLETCHLELQRLKTRLEPESGWRAVRKALVWPLKEGEMKKTLSNLERLKSTMQLALTADQAALSLAIRDDVGNLSQSFSRHMNDQKRQDILAWLDPADPDINYMANRKKRQPNTGTWLLRSRPFEHWLHSSRSFLWLYGIPLAYFYFDFNDPGKRNIGPLLKSLITQLSAQSENIPKPLLELYQNHKNRNNTPDDDALIAAFRDIILSFHSAYIVFDALDESSNCEETLQFIKLLQEWGLDRLHFLTTSRQLSDIEEVLRDLATDKICLQDYSDNDDIYFYIVDTLANDKALAKWPPDIREQILQTLLTKGDGMFQWVVCQLDMLKRCTSISSIKKAMTALPKSLDETYERILLAIDEGYRTDVMRTLQALTEAVTPLKLEEVVEILAMDFNSNPPQFNPNSRLLDPKSVLTMCSSLITYSNESATNVVRDRPTRLRLAHASVADYLTQPKQSPFHFSKQAARDFMAQACLGYLLNPKFSFGQDSETLSMQVKGSPFLSTSVGLSDFGEGQKRFRDFPFLHHVVRFWPSYIAKRSDNPEYRIDARTKELVQIFFATRKMPYGGNFAFWVGMLIPDAPAQLVRSTHPLYYAASFGLTEVVRIILDTEEDLDINILGGRVEATALHVACYRKHYNIVKLLLERGADPNIPNNKNESPLYWATAPRGDENIVELLLRYGAHPESTPWRYYDMIGRPYINIEEKV
ncbi:hypothetical protein B7494_g5250 [Chlorociboria aeruginascens]|nr:hypothetical protein B7494_g5250 [Chlorociboria aeruginascens]